MEPANHLKLYLARARNRAGTAQKATMSIEEQVARHYGRTGLEQAILDALIASGKSIERLTASDLSAADEFHLGWRAATVELARDLALGPGLEVLDIGSGLGGPARYFAEAHGCRVTGLDVTEEYVNVARSLTRRCGLADRVSFRQASALTLPFEDGAFDRASLIHVAMNIPDKATLFTEVRRVLKPGGLFGVYEVMHISDAPIPHPTPWAVSQDDSFVEAPQVYRERLAGAGFVIEAEHDRTGMVRALAREMRETVARHGTPPLGLHLLIGPATRDSFGNVFFALDNGIIAPIEMVARAV